MGREWHIDGASALIVNGVRFTLQEVKWRSTPSLPLISATMWVRDSNQSAGGLVITKPLYLPDTYWTYWDDYGNDFSAHGVVFKERTWTYYGEQGYTPGGTTYSITTLSPYTTLEAAGDKVLTLSGLRLYDESADPHLYFNISQAQICRGGYIWLHNATYFQLYGLGIVT